MIRISNLLVATLVFSCVLLDVKPVKAVCCDIEIEGRIAAFVPNSTTFHEVYGRVGPMYQVEATCPLTNCFRGWANVSYFTKAGQSDPLKDHTRLQFIPFSAGIKYCWCYPKELEVHVGAGACYTWLREKADIDEKPKAVTTGGVGGVFKFNVCKRCQNFYTSVFVDYLLQDFTVHTIDSKERVDISGFAIGFAVGKCF